MIGASDYAVYNTPKGRFALRIADHNANGDNFEQDDANINISIYVAFREFNAPNSKVKYADNHLEVKSSIIRHCTGRMTVMVT